jgi:hypothetical protein
LCYAWHAELSQLLLVCRQKYTATVTAATAGATVSKISAALISYPSVQNFLAETSTRPGLKVSPLFRFPSSDECIVNPIKITGVLKTWERYFYFVLSLAISPESP